MGYHRARQGECLSSIAQDYGFGDHQVIYQRPENAAFRQKRPNPNTICPGDLLFVPELEIKEVPKATGQRHSFKLKHERVRLRVCLKDDLHRPYAITKYHLRVGGDEWEGITDHLGMVEHYIEADATEGKITVFCGSDKPDEGYTFSLKLGYLDPIEERSGVDARLLNLGFGPLDGEEPLSDDDRTKALQAFQKKSGLEVTGKLTDDTRRKLLELHDGE